MEFVEMILYSHGEEQKVLIPLELIDVDLSELAKAGLIYCKKG